MADANTSLGMPTASKEPMSSWIVVPAMLVGVVGGLWLITTVIQKMSDASDRRAYKRGFRLDTYIP